MLKLTKIFKNECMLIITMTNSVFLNCCIKRTTQNVNMYIRDTYTHNLKIGKLTINLCIHSSTLSIVDDATKWKHFM